MNRLVLLVALVGAAPGCGLYARGIDLATTNNVARAEFKDPVTLEITNNSLHTVVDMRLRPMTGQGMVLVGGSSARVLDQGKSLLVENIGPDRWTVIAVDDRGWIQRKNFYVGSGEDVAYVIDRSGWERPSRAWSVDE